MCALACVLLFGYGFTIFFLFVFYFHDVEGVVVLGFCLFFKKELKVGD